MITLAFTIMNASAQENNSLIFGADGEFKILHVSNCIDNSNNVSRATKGLVGRYIEVEKPQYIVFTIGRKNTSGIAKLVPELKELCKGIPCAVVCADGEGNSSVPVMSFNGSTISHIVYLMGEETTFEQVAWYRQQSIKYANNNSGIPVPSVAFVLRPMPEFDTAYNEYGSQKMLKKLISHTGEKKEEVSCQENNAGLFTAMIDCNDVRGVFSGYDDRNDYALVWKNILLAYGRHTSMESMYEPGARIIILNENDESILTYIRNENNSVTDRCVYPTDFSVTK